MRVSNWNSALIEVFESAQGKRFRWGVHDCFQFIAKWHRAVTGEHRRAHFPRYQTKAEAMRILDQFAGAKGILVRAIGEPVLPGQTGWGSVAMGDIVLVDMGLGLQPAGCMGIDCFAPGMRNLQYRKTQSAVAAWIL